MRIGACIPLGAPEAVAAGLDYIEPQVDDLLMCEKDDAAFEAVAEKVAAAEIKPEAANCFFPGRLPNVGPDANPVALDAWVSIACRRAAVIGVKLLVFGSGGSRRLPEGFARDKAIEQIVDSLKRYGLIAAEHSVTIGLESLSSHDTNFITTVDEAAEVVRAAAQPNVGITVDTFHMLCDGEGPESIRRAAGLVVHAHCAEKANRGPLGATGEDHRPYFRALKDAGFDGRISLECKWKELAAELPAGTAAVREQWQTA